MRLPVTASAAEREPPTANLAHHSLQAHFSLMTVDAQALRATLAEELGSEFELGDIVGSGGFAVVFRARDRVLHRDVAVKVLNPSVALDEKAEERFRREARLIAGLEHPNIVPVFRAGIAGRVPYMVMRFVVGQSLEHVLEDRQYRPLAWPEATKIALQAADALAYAHSRGVVHLDVKPANLLLDQAQNVLVADFGIARVLAEQIAPMAAGTPEAATGGAAYSTVSGTILYMSPEQALGELVDARADVYALGVVLYQMLTGRVPFQGASPAATLKQQLDGDFALDASHIAPALHPIIRRALAPSPNDRFANAGELRDGLAAFRAGMASRSARRRVGVAVGAVGVLVTLVTAGGLLWKTDTVADRSPAIDVVGQLIPDSLLQQLRALGAVDSSETVRYVFAPAGGTVRDAFVLTDRRAIRLTEGVPRAHLLTEILGASTVKSGNGSNAVILALRRNGGTGNTADTLYTGLGARERASLSEKMIAFLFVK